MTDPVDIKIIQGTKGMGLIYDRDILNVSPVQHHEQLLY